MHKILACCLCFCVLFCACSTASAATSKLPKEVLEALETKWPNWEVASVTYKTSDDKYSDEKTPASYYYDEHGHAAAFVVLSKGTSNRLVLLEKKSGTWKVVGSSTSAVFQGNWIPSISCETYGQFDFYYSYRPYEEPIHYVFKRKNDGHWYLTQYDYNSEKDGRVCISVASDCLTYKTERNGNKSTKVYGVFANQFSQFSLSNLPMTSSEARTSLTNPPTIPDGTLTAERIKFGSGKKYPVYQGPGTEYGRAANGKASVSTNDWIQVFGEENGYIMIQYDISKDQYRIGWIDKKALPSGEKVDEFAFQPVQGYLPLETHLTDDPLNSEKVVLTLSEGTTVKWLASMGDWAYIETTSGALIRGFVPISSIAVQQTSVRYDVMESVSGYWTVTSDGETIFESILLNNDGSFTGWLRDQTLGDANENVSGHWYVYETAHTQSNWLDIPFELILDTSDNSSIRVGLHLDGTILKLATEESIMSYDRCEMPMDKLH